MCFQYSYSKLDLLYTVQAGSVSSDGSCISEVMSLFIKFVSENCERIPVGQMFFKVRGNLLEFSTSFYGLGSLAVTSTGLQWEFCVFQCGAA